jgi:uncharacterized protein YpmB
MIVSIFLVIFLILFFVVAYAAIWIVFKLMQEPYGQRKKKKVKKE